MSTVVCLAIAISALAVGDGAGAAPQPNVSQYHPAAVRGQPIELEVQIPEVEHVRFQMDGMLETLFDHAAPFNFLIPTADLKKGKHSWGARAYDDSCCVYGSTAGSIQIYPLPKVRAPVIAPRMSAGGILSGLVVAKVARGLTVRAWASSPRSSAESVDLPLRLRHRHRSRRIYEFPRGLTVKVGKRIDIEVEVAPAKRLVQHGVEVRGRLARLRLRRTRSGSISALQSAVTPCTTAAARKGSDPQPLPGAQSCTSVPSTTPRVSIVCIKSMQCRPGPAPAPRGRRG
jgi:hypothetical protein